MQINKLLYLTIGVILLVSCKEEKKEIEATHDHAKTEEVATPKKVLSPHKSVMAMVGDAHVHIDYSSPGVRGRIVFGGLVGYDNVWQAGAHMATWIETNKNLSVADQVLPAGKYGFFVIPSPKEWTIIFNTNWDQHGKDKYDEKEDVIRFTVTPSMLDDIVEHLEYEVTKSNETEGAISLSWEKVRVSFPFKVA